MQPMQKFKKSLLASALVLGIGNSFTASADLFTVTAGAVPDVAVSFVGTNNQVSFGSSVIGNKVGESCIMAGKTGMADSLLMWDADGGNDQDAAASFGYLTGNACINSTDAASAGKPAVIEIDAADASTVSVTVADVTGAGYTYTPTAESCVVDFDRTTAADSCVSLAGNTVTGIGMSLTQTDGAAGAALETASTWGYAAISGKTRMVLAGSITLSSEIAAGSVIADSIVVQVTYE